MAIPISWSMCLEACEGELDPDFCIEKPVKFWEFSEQLGLQLLACDPKKIRI